MCICMSFAYNLHVWAQSFVTLPLLPKPQVGLRGPWQESGSVLDLAVGPSTKGRPAVGDSGRGPPQRPSSGIPWAAGVGRRQGAPQTCPGSGADAGSPAVCARRRGSSVALVLDVQSLGAVEPICSVSTPREVTLHFLRTAGRPLTRWALQHQPPSPEQLEEEFMVRAWGPLCPPDSEAASRQGPTWHCGQSSGRARLRSPTPPTRPEPPHPTARAALPGRGGGRRGPKPLLTHSLPPRPTRRSPPTSSAPKTWIFLATHPRTGTRPSCQVRPAQGAGPGAVPEAGGRGLTDLGGADENRGVQSSLRVGGCCSKPVAVTLLSKGPGPVPCCHPHVTDGEAESRRGCVTLPRSHSQWRHNSL